MSTGGSLNPETVALIAVVIIIAVTALSLLMVVLYLCGCLEVNCKDLGSKCHYRWRRERRQNENEERSLVASNCLSHPPSILLSTFVLSSEVVLFSEVV